MLHGPGYRTREYTKTNMNMLACARLHNKNCSGLQTPYIHAIQRTYALLYLHTNCAIRNKDSVRVTDLCSARVRQASCLRFGAVPAPANHVWPRY